MGREIKRVALDFDWPLDKVWKGYLTPYRFPACPDCTHEELPTLLSRMFPTEPRGSGYSRAAYAVSQTFYPHMIGGPMADRLAWHDKIGQAEVDYLLEKGRLRDYRERYNPETRAWEPRGEPVTAAMVNAGQHHGGTGPKGAHDAINHSYLVEFRCQQLGIDQYCKSCNGHGDDAADEQREAAENWEGTDPPAGDGWQLWETVSEGSPVSPVFATAEELAEWMTQNKCTVEGPVSSYEAALRFVLAGWAPSMVTSPETGLTSGVEWVGRERAEG